MVAARRGYEVGAAAVVLVTLFADVGALDTSALDARLPTNSVGHYDPAKYALPLPSNATAASHKGASTFASNMSNRMILGSSQCTTYVIHQQTHL